MLEQNNTLVALCATGDVEPDMPLRVDVEGESYAVFNIDGAYHVTQDLCTHGPGSLADGFIMGDEIECPIHQGRFHIPSGRPTFAPCTEALKVWPVQVIDGMLYIDLAQPAD